MPQNEDIANNALELLAANSTWVLVRHQWLIDNMRSILTGESQPPVEPMYEFNSLIPPDLKLPEHLMQRFTDTKSSLEQLWLSTTKASHPMSGLSIFEQLNNYQRLAHQFMQSSKEANQQLWQEFTMRDTLTGAWTRLTLHANLSHELQHSKRYASYCAIALLDQDQFKSINDRWGHVMGDQVLAKTAEVIAKNLRPTDKLYRFGGDEWLILMPGTTAVTAEETLHRIRRLFDSLAFKSNTGEPFYSSFSFGIAAADTHQTPEDWIAAADHQLYNKKCNQTL